MIAVESTERLLASKAAALTGNAPRKRVSTWAPPDLSQFAYGIVLAFDQTTTKTGYCLMSHHPEHGLTVWRKGKMVEPPVPDKTGFADQLQRAVWMAERTLNIIQETLDRGLSGEEPLHRQSLTVVHEMPAVRGMRNESSLLAALGVRLACSRLNLPVVMINKQHVAKVLCPPADRIGKPAIGRAVNRYLDTRSRDWNQDTRDALALALVSLYDRAREQEKVDDRAG